ncbi:DUF3087 domain-containing protein [Stutzerimonas chloritidismutans]|uniref:DUF3087 domain-containing protein n=1 Tax=Stutzerimonas chloritidismutans TaxID=203192 RepID=UPI003F18270D
MVIFEIEPMNPERYRQQTRRSSLAVIATFAITAMGFAMLAVAAFGGPGGDNLRYNIAGVVAGFLVTAALVRLVYARQRWMACAVYGWRLKRSLMRITNQMHQVKAGVTAGDRDAMQVLRFYHLGLAQMHDLDGNSGALAEQQAEIEQHRQAMLAHGIDIEQTRLDDVWLAHVKGFQASR